MRSNAMERFFGRLLVAEERMNDAHGARKSSRGGYNQVGALPGVPEAREPAATSLKRNVPKTCRTYNFARSQSPDRYEASRERHLRSAIPSATPPSPHAVVPTGPGPVAKHASSTLPRPPSRSHSRGRTISDPTPPAAPPPRASQAAAPRRHRLLGPMPEAPPTSVLQSRPATSQTRSRTTIGAMRHRHYKASLSPPARTGSPHPTSPPHLLSGLPQPHTRRQHAASRNPAQQTSMEARNSLSPDPLAKHTIRSLGAQEQVSGSGIRHRSTTPVRVTKDAQLRRDTIAAQHPRPPSQDSPLRRRATSVARAPTAQPARQSWEGVRTQVDQSFKPTPPQYPRTTSSTVAREGAAAISTTAARLPSGPARFQCANDVPTAVGSMATSSQTSVAPSVVGISEKVRSSAARAVCQQEGHLDGYELGPVIGEGGFCKVKSGRHIASKQPVAIKVINKNALKDEHDWRRVGREIRILKRLKNHPAVIHVYDVISVKCEVYVIQELAQGGSLLDYIRDRKRISEDLAMRLFLQIVAGLQYCHQNEVVHRDIKLENLLMDSERNMKLIDFGLAAIFTQGVPLRVHCGSPSYAAPEIIGRQNYEGPPVDVWSLGIVTFAMVCGHLPFYSRNGRSDLSRKIMAGKYHEPDHMSDSMKDIVAGMLMLDPTRRVTLAQVMTHRWVTGSLAHRSLYLPHALLPYDEATGMYQVDQRVLDHMVDMGVDLHTVLHDLQHKECNMITATYFLLTEALRDSKGLPVVTSSTRRLGAALHVRSNSAKSAHGFSLDIDDAGDRDDQAHFAPSRSRREA